MLKKYPDGKTLKGVTIYNHTTNEGNINVTIADSGKMYTMMDNNYLVFELYNGVNYMDYKNTSGGNYNDTQFVKNSFKKNRLVFALESFGMKRTDESQFKYHEYMKDVSALSKQVDSIRKEIAMSKKMQLGSMDQFYNHHLKKIIKDTLSKRIILPGKWVDERMKPLHEESKMMESFETAFTQAKSVQDHYKTNVDIEKSKLKDANRADVELWHKFTMAFACFVMFLIGSSLGSIIKKGGFGMPVLISITFFILMYVLMQLGDKYAKEGLWYVITGVWMPDAILLAFGIYFLYKATNDARLFDSDIYDVYFDKIKTYWNTRIRKKREFKTT